LRGGGDAVDAVTAALAVLEDDPLCNAGYGSNLNIEGRVECDAGVMDGASLSFGAVAAAPGLRHPARVATRLLRTQLAGRLSLDREPPMSLSGRGAFLWAKENGESTVEDNRLISPAAAKTYQKYMERLTSSEVPSSVDAPASPTLTPPMPAATLSTRTSSVTSELTSEVPPAESEVTIESAPQDTVGACAIDARGQVAAGVSSGGIWLKHPGRTGPASAYGAGCWAENRREREVGAAVSTTGRGEQLIKTRLAQELAAAAFQSNHLTHAVSQTFHDQFLHSRFLARDATKQGGALVLFHQAGVGELTWAHTTSSMCVGYYHLRAGGKPVAWISRLPERSTDGLALHMQGVAFNLKEEGG